MWWLGVLVLTAAVPATIMATGAVAAQDVTLDPVPECTPGEFGDLNPGPGEESFLFILTSPDTGPWELTVQTSEGEVTADGVQQGQGGSVHFVITVDAGTTLESAVATNGTAQSQLTLSHCELGPPVTTTTTQPTTTTTAAAATTTTVKPAAPAAVTVTPRLTG
jgi:hypothetical protein